MKRLVRAQRLALAVLDALLVTLALYAGYHLRLYFDGWPLHYYNQFLAALPVFILVRVSLFYLFNLYRGILRYAGTSELLAIFFSTLAGSVILATLNLVVVPLLPPVEWLPEPHKLARVPLAVMVIEFVFTLLLVGGGRFSRRVALSSRFLHRADTGDLRRILIVGAGDSGEVVARQMRHAPVQSYLPVAFVDDDKDKHGRSIHGIPVAGGLKDLPKIVKDLDVEEVHIAEPAISPGKIREIVSLCEHARVGFKILPSIGELLDGRVSINRIRPVEIEDLLGRDEVRFDLSEDRNYLVGETVIITGAGGSIGSELCRQLLRFGPKQIILYGHGENSIYEISTELNATCGGVCVLPVIGDVRDSRKLGKIVAQHRPAIFFHAAAHKHVPLMENDPDEAVKNNVLGTLNVASAADDIGAKKFILISSDKAVRPTNIMGASKRVAEMIVFCMARKSKTQFVAVRFGNVLGSRGSVIPLFRRQIARGGPVTLTHPEITRFFMTIPEAVSLVIQAGSMSEQRRLYLLDMGAPVKIEDLARNLIRLSGFEPDKDIEIKYTGLRPGEKLTEELLTAGENVKATGIGKIFTTEPEDVDCEMLWAAVEELSALAKLVDTEGVRKKLKNLVPDFHDQQLRPSHSTKR